MPTDAETSIGYLAEPIRAKVIKQDADRSEIWLEQIGAALRYLKDDFDSSYGGDVGWKHAAAMLERAHADPKFTPHATKALMLFLQGDGRIVTSDPRVVGQFAAR